MNVIQTGGEPFTSSSIVALAADKPAFVVKSNVEDYLRECNVKFIDCGLYDNYLDSVAGAAAKIITGEAAYGIVFTYEADLATAFANKLGKNIRAIMADNPTRVVLGRNENNVNFCVLDLSTVGFGVAMESIWKFLTSGFSGGDYDRILRQLEKEEENENSIRL